MARCRRLRRANCKGNSPENSTWKARWGASWAEVPAAVRIIPRSWVTWRAAYGTVSSLPTRQHAPRSLNRMVILMTDQEIVGLVRTLLNAIEPQQEECHDQVQLDSTIEELGCDSVTLLGMITDLEKHLQVQIPDESLLHVRTVGDLVALLQQAKEAK